MTAAETPPPPKRLLRWLLIALAVLVVLVALFYCEEDWRGRRAWASCRQDLQGRGAKLDWGDYIPAPVPANENIFGVPQIQKWFVKNGTNQSDELTEKIHYPGGETSARIAIAQLTIGQADTPAPAGATELQWEDPQRKEAAARVVRSAIGPVASDPSGAFYTLKPLAAIQPAKIFLQCATPPGDQDLENFMSTPLFADGESSNEDIRVERTNDGSYSVTMRAPSTVVDFLNWNRQLEPEFTLILNALQRPNGRMDGDYSDPAEAPAPNFTAVRNLAERLAAVARCYLALGQPGKAVDELTFLHQLSRLLEARPAGRPISLSAVMTDVGVTGMYVEIVKDGLRLKLWRESQLAELEDQLKEINLRPFLVNAILQEPAGICQMAEATPRQLFRAHWSRRRSFVLYHVIPQGWVCQNLVVYANLQQKLAEALGLTDQPLLPNKIETATHDVETAVADMGRSPFRYLAGLAVPNVARAAKSFAATQTIANQAQIVCALDLYRLVRGAYPETLDSLAPQFIEKVPNDVVDGAPPHYHRNPDGTFSLYSVGWDEVDHGGEAGADLVWPVK